MRLLAAICTLVLLGVAPGLAANEVPQDKSAAEQQTSWHDGSIGGAYGIGPGWSLELLPRETETIFDTVMIHETPELLVVPPEFEWVKDTGQDFSDEPKTVIELFTVPAVWMSVTADVEVEPAKTGYYLVEPVYHADGSLETPGGVKTRHVPPETKTVTRRVVKTPARTEERLIPNDPPARINGNVRVLKTPAYVRLADNADQFGTNAPPPTKQISRRIQLSQKIVVRQSDGKAAHIFDNFEALAAFVETLK